MAGYSAAFAPNGGLHPRLQLSIPRASAAVAPPAASCTLFVAVDVPPALIADRYQLLQLQRDGRLGVAAEGALVQQGETDLEVPVWRAGPARVLVRLTDAGGGKELDHGGEAETMQDKGKSKERQVLAARGQMEVEIPLHLRYQTPVPQRWVDDNDENDSGRRRRRRRRADLVPVEVEWPRVFWTCSSSIAVGRPDLSACPPEAIPGLVNSFPHHTNNASSLFFLEPDAPLATTSAPTCPPLRPPPLRLTAPTGVLADLAPVEAFTAAAIWACFVYLSYTALRVYRRGRQRDRIKEKEQ